MHRLLAHSVVPGAILVGGLSAHQALSGVVSALMPDGTAAVHLQAALGAAESTEFQREVLQLAANAEAALASSLVSLQGAINAFLGWGTVSVAAIATAREVQLFRQAKAAQSGSEVFVKGV